MQKHPLKLLLWNVYLATPDTERGRVITDIIRDKSPDVACFTEVTEALLPRNGHTTLAEADYGYKPLKGRKVALWSRQPWTQVDSIGSDKLPSGRFVTGVTYDVRFVGVCIPWKDAHVITGRKNRQPWEDHLSYLRELGPLMERFCKMPEPVCLLGDYNQRMPRKYQPEEVAQALQRILAHGLHLATDGCVDAGGEQLIDHIATDGKLVCEVDSIIPRFAPGGVELSDHVGITAGLM